jgi:hypothetical protein
MRVRRFLMVVAAAWVGAGCGGYIPGNENNEIVCSSSDENRCWNAGCNDGSNWDSPNAAGASCSSECQPSYCDGYCECENWLVNPECGEC